MASLDKTPTKASGQPRYFSLGILALAVLASVIYQRAFAYPMIFDDLASIIENESVHSLQPLLGQNGQAGPLNPSPNQPFTARPLVNLSIAVDYHLSGEDPRIYRIVNLIIHVATAIFLAAIVILTLNRPASVHQFESHSVWLGFASAAIWMVHPVHTETVIYLTQRTELMMGMLYLLTLLFCIGYWTSARTYQRTLFLSLAASSAIAGMLCKETMASVPAMALLYEHTFLRRSFREIVKQSWKLYASLSLCFLPIIALYAMGSGTPAAGFNNTIPAVDYWMTEARVFFDYWRLTFWPWPLVMNYQIPTVTTLSDGWPGVVAMLIYAGITGWLVWRRSVIGYALIWFLAVLSPTLVVPLPDEEFVERRLYLAIAPLAPIVIIGFERFLRRRQSQFITAGLIVVFSIVCVRAIPRFADRMTVWLHVLDHDSQNSLAMMRQGLLEFNEGQEASGIKRLETAFAARPDRKPCVLVLAKAYKNQQRYADEINVYRTAIEVTPNEPSYHYNLGLAFDRVRKPELARKHYEETVRLDPTAHYAHYNLGMLLAERGDLVAAIEHFETAVEMDPNYDYCLNLMTRHLAARRYDQAAVAAKKLLLAAQAEHRTNEVPIIERTIRTLERHLQTLSNE